MTEAVLHFKHNVGMKI